MSEAPKIFAAMAAIMADVGAIGKAHKNSDQGYSFRGIDDVYNALHEAMASRGVFTTSEILDWTAGERPSKSGGILSVRTIKIRYTFWAVDGSSVVSEVIGEGMDSSDKASNKAMAVAHKYALLQVFAVPTEDPKDPEYESPQLAPPAPVSGSQDNPAQPKPRPKTKSDDLPPEFGPLAVRVSEFVRDKSDAEKNQWRDLLSKNKKDPAKLIELGLLLDKIIAGTGAEGLPFPDPVQDADPKAPEPPLDDFEAQAERLADAKDFTPDLPIW